jgi:hypothetical protein
MSIPQLLPSTHRANARVQGLWAVSQSIGCGRRNRQFHPHYGDEILFAQTLKHSRSLFLLSSFLVCRPRISNFDSGR